MILENNYRAFVRHRTGTPVEIDIGSEKMMIPTKDISRSGVGFICNRPLPTGNTVKVTVSVQNRLYRLKGQVARSDKAYHEWYYDSGIRFINPPDEFGKNLEEEFAQIARHRALLSQELNMEVTEAQAASDRILKQHETPKPRFSFLSRWMGI